MKEYTKPEVVITKFTTEDIITTSSVNSGMENKSELDSTGAKDFSELDWI